jgi:hypothetical protein
MRARARAAALDEQALLEIAHLQCAWRMTAGAAHSLNNALTAVTGLANVPGEELELQQELDRCIRISRALTSHHSAHFGRTDETELGAVLRRVAPALEDTLSRRFQLVTEASPEPLYLEADPARIELLVFLLVYRLADLTCSDARLRIAVSRGDKPDTALLELELVDQKLSALALDEVLDPAAAPDAGSELSLEAASAVVAGCGGSLAARPVPDGIRLRTILPTLDLD